jgi:hypothetical protein
LFTVIYFTICVVGGAVGGIVYGVYLAVKGED